MKFKHINPRNLSWLAPASLIDPMFLARVLDEHLDQLFLVEPSCSPSKWDVDLRFWIEIKDVGDGFDVSMQVPTDASDNTFLGRLIISMGDCDFVVPINAFLKGSDNLEGTHTLYQHALNTDASLGYIGITKHQWFKRYAQHRSRAATGSNLLFHRAIREHGHQKTHHTVLLTGLDLDTAYAFEEEFVELGTLYPRGLNMIPGGKAGLRYLQSLGFPARTPVERDKAIVDLMARASLPGGAPNPLCAARWACDQDFVNSVICGHSGRLTLSQVRLARMLSASGKSLANVAEYLGDKVDRVKMVLAGATYARVK